MHWFSTKCLKLTTTIELFSYTFKESLIIILCNTDWAIKLCDSFSYWILYVIATLAYNIFKNQIVVAEDTNIMYMIYECYIYIVYYSKL